jgi:hypothetical protein
MPCVVKIEEKTCCAMGEIAIYHFIGHCMLQLPKIARRNCHHQVISTVCGLSQNYAIQRA